MQDISGCKRIFATDEISANEIHVDIELMEDILCGIPTTISLINNSISSATITSYEWSVASKGDDLLSFEENPTFEILNYGNYDVRLIAEADNCKDSINMTNLFSVHQIPVSDFEGINSSLCDGNESRFINLSSIEKGVIDNSIWSIDGLVISKEDSLFYTFDSSGTYIVKLISESNFGCTDSITKSIVIQPGLDIVFPSDTLICIGEEVLLAVTIPVNDRIDNYQWILPKGDSCLQCDQINVTGKLSESYTFKLTSKESCIYQKNVSVDVAPVISPEIELIYDDTICKDVNANVRLETPLPDWEISWLNDQDTLCPNCKEIELNLSNTTVISVAITNQYGCISDSTFIINVESSIPDFLIAGKVICEGAETTLRITGNVNNPVWKQNNTILCDNCDSLVYSSLTTETLFVEVRSEENCMYKDSIVIASIPIDGIDAGRDTLICLGEVIKFNGVGLGTPSWMPATDILNPNDYNAQVKGSKSGYYTLTTTLGECILTDSVFVEVLEEVDVSTVGDTVCFGEDLRLSVSGNAANYIWFLNGQLLGEMDSLTMSGDTKYDFEVVGKRQGCPDNMKPIDILVYPQIDYEPTMHNYLLDLNEKKQIEASYNEKRKYAYDWLPLHGLDCYDCPKPFIYGVDTATMFTNVIIDMETLCEVSDSVFIRVSNKCSDEGFNRPNVISSHAENSNNTFKMSPLDDREFLELQIFDRWGNGVFETKDVNQSWDGKINGTSALSGVYVYVVQAICPQTNEKYFFSGDVTLIK